MESRLFIVPFSAIRQRYFDIIVMKVQIDTFLEQTKKIIADDVDAWMLHSQTIATIMSNRTGLFGMTQ